MFEQLFKLALLASLVGIAITLSKGFKNMSTSQADLDAGIADLKTTVADAGAKISKSLDDLVAKLNTGSTTVDFSSELADIRAVASGLADLGKKAADDDPGVTAPPTT